MSPTLKTFRVQFLDRLMARYPAVLGESDLTAADIDAALLEIGDFCLPPGARACRLSLLDGGEVAYRVIPGPHGPAVLLVKFA